MVRDKTIRKRAKPGNAALRCVATTAMFLTGLGSFCWFHAWSVVHATSLWVRLGRLQDKRI